MNRIAALVIALTLLAAGPVAGAEPPQKTIFYNVTTDEAWAAGMAMAQATRALESGYGVVIFLNVRSVLLASKAFKSDINAQVGASVQDQLKGAMAKGAQVIICPMCMTKAGLAAEDLIEGIVQGGPDVTLEAMTADHTTVISY
jgi:predicted peroxiredoxin